jgi:hypothetical protein
MRININIFTKNHKLTKLKIKKIKDYNKLLLKYLKIYRVKIVRK